MIINKGNTLEISTLSRGTGFYMFLDISKMRDVNKFIDVKTVSAYRNIKGGVLRLKMNGEDVLKYPIRELTANLDIKKISYNIVDGEAVLQHYEIF